MNLGTQKSRDLAIARDGRQPPRAIELVDCNTFPGEISLYFVGETSGEVIEVKFKRAVVAVTAWIESNGLTDDQGSNQDTVSVPNERGMLQSVSPVADFLDTPRQSLPEAAAWKALQIEQELSEAHDALGWVQFVYGWNWTKAEQHLKPAFELNASPISRWRCRILDRIRVTITNIRSTYW
jgi:malate synthase